MPSDIFLSIVRLTDNCDELKSTKELVTREIQSLVSVNIDSTHEIKLKHVSYNFYDFSNN